MKRLLFFALTVALALAPAPARLRAQIPPPPTPSPDPHTYTDSAMNFTAPPDAFLVGRRVIPVNQLGQDLQTVALWVVHPGKDDARTISLAMESFEGPPDQWEGQFESQMHSAGSSDLLVRRKQSMSLLNGMPANFVEITSGSGFTSKKEFAVVWADGQRGIALSYTARLGDASSVDALAALKNVSAVRYPIEQP
jgi:hypothetical protein